MTEATMDIRLGQLFLFPKKSRECVYELHDVTDNGTHVFVAKSGRSTTKLSRKDVLEKFSVTGEMIRVHVEEEPSPFESFSYIDPRTFMDPNEASGKVERLAITRLKRRYVKALSQQFYTRTLAAKATEKSFASDILTAFGDPRASRGTKDSMLGRAYDYMAVKGSQIMFIDEVQHLDHRYEADQKKSSRVFSAENSSVTDMMKVIMIRGRIPIVFLGIDGARNLILGDDQMNMRNLGEIDFSQLRPERPAEQRMFVHYLGSVGILMQQRGIFPKESDLVSGEMPAKVHEVVGGRVGTASNLILAAATIARERAADQLLETHLSAAVDEWAIPAKLISYNPFRSGIRQRELRAA